MFINFHFVLLFLFLSSLLGWAFIQNASLVHTLHVCFNNNIFILRELRSCSLLSRNFRRTIFPTKNSDFLAQCISKWNESPNVTRHKLFTKTSQRINNYIVQLLNGTFCVKNVIKPKFFNSHKISSEKYIGQKWSKETIIEGIRRLSLLSLEGYWPDDKRNVKNLDMLLYNPLSGTSMLLLVMEKEPLPYYQQVHDTYPEATKIIFEFLQHKPNTEEKRTIIHHVKRFYEFAQNIPNKDHYIIRSNIRGGISLIKNYIGWIEHSEWIKRLNIHMFNVNGTLFDRFVEDEEERLGLKLR